ncbi:hypothetical protein RKD23_007070 [Streptomyces sp. SAI-170]|uniref:DUF6461 domain-containing protein n=1 Tax=Streptomyces sp. SAI-170 TaxID=3377729 RepID=UPI003C7D6B4F
MMSDDADRGLELFRAGDFPLYTLTFVRDLPPDELLRRMGVDEETLAPRDARELSEEFADDFYDADEPVVTTGSDGGWTWAWEQGGTHGLDDRVLRAVSAGTRAVVLHHNEKPMDRFRYAVDRESVVDFDTLGPVRPVGGDPTRLDPFMRPLGLVPGGVAPLYSVLALCENAFGIRLARPAESDEERWSGRLLPLPY